MNETPIFSLRRTWGENRRGYFYDLIFHPDCHRISGDAAVAYRGVGEYNVQDWEISMKIYNSLREQGLDDTDRVARIMTFFPNGVSDKERLGIYGKHGVGTRLLEILEEDALCFIVKGIFIITNEDTKDFLKKRGYTVIYETDSHIFTCYKELRVEV